MTTETQNTTKRCKMTTNRCKTNTEMQNNHITKRRNVKRLLEEDSLVLGVLLYVDRVGSLLHVSSQGPIFS